MAPRTVQEARLTLQATDKDFKTQVGLLLELSTWEQAALTADGMLKVSSDGQLKLNGRFESLQERVKELEDQVRDIPAAIHSAQWPPAVSTVLSPHICAWRSASNFLSL